VIVDGEDGRLVPFGDVPALADTLAFLADHPEVRAAMGARGEQKVYAQHTWERKHTLVHRLYLDLVKA
jgi:glycosyltransferase involved in cell wall biosynthesis